MTVVLLCIGGLAIATSLVYFAHFRNPYVTDSATYIAPALSLAAGHGFVDADGKPETVRTPGYPLLIAPFLWARLDLRYLVLLQHLLRALIAVATTAMAYRLSGSRRQAFLAGLVVCLDLPMLETANVILAESSFTVILLAIVWLLWSETGQPEKPWACSLASGFLSGLSVLVRPVSLFFVVPATAYLLLTRRTHRLQAALAFALAFALLPGLWAARNHEATGYFTFTSISGFDLLGYRAAGVLAINDPGDFSANLKRRQAELDAQVCRDLAGSSGADCSRLPVAQRSQYALRLGRSILLQHPGAYVKLALRGSAVLMLGADAIRVGEILGVSEATARRIVLLYTLPCVVLAMMGALRLWKENRRFLYLAALVMLYFIAVSSGAEGYSRYRVPIVPLYAILIAGGVDWILLRVLRQRRAPPSQPS